MIVVRAAVEGDLDEEVLRQLVREAGAELGRVYGKKGKQHLRQQIQSYSSAARFDPWVVLVDLDNDNCPPALRQAWLSGSSPFPGFRIAVRAIESWILADREAIADFLKIDLSQVPIFPEAESDPKRKLVDLARTSRRREIQKDIVPRQGGSNVGRAYSSRLKTYIEDHWRPEVAALHSDSLKRCRLRLAELVQRHG